MAARGSRSSTVKFKSATVSQERDGFVLTVGASKKPIAIGEINDAASVRKLAGKGEVLAAVSGRTIAALGRRVQGCYWIICYVPAPDILRKIRPEIRQELVRKYVNEKIIDKAFANEMKPSF